MRMPFCLARDHRAAATGILLIAAVLLVGVAACDRDGEGTATYQLAVSSASGGSVTTPGPGTFVYDVGTVVHLLAAPDDGYRFHSWTGDTSSIGDASAASTTITMNGNYAIVANFEIEDGEEPGGGSNGGGPDEGGPYS